jgi:hypothetical protein
LFFPVLTTFEAWVEDTKLLAKGEPDRLGKRLEQDSDKESTSLLDFAYQLSQATPSTANLASYIVSLRRLLAEQKYDHYDAIMQRTSFVYKAKLAAWRSLLTRCEVDLRNRGLDSKKILRGLERDGV